MATAGVIERELLIDFPQNHIFVRTSHGYSVRANPPPVLRRAFYLSAEKDIDEQIPAATLSLAVPFPETLLCLVPPTEEPPTRVAKVFKRHGTIPHKVLLTSGQSKECSAEIYFAASGGYAWDTDLEKNVPGYFLTGTRGTSRLWKITYIEKDPFDSSIISMVPMVMSGGFPRVKLPDDADPLLAGEIEKQYEALQQAVQSHRYRSVVTEARNLVESVIPLRLGWAPSNNLADTLKNLRSKLFQTEAKGAPLPVSPLTYHLGEKLRLLHQRTHTGAAIRHGRPLSPEFALTAAQDIIEILRDLGYTNDSRGV